MTETIKQISKAIEGFRSDLRTMADYIWDNPETAYKEYKACAAQVDFLARHGFEAKANVYGVETAYATRFKNGDGPTFAIAAEYDALPGIGHGCGHNLICSAGIAAFLSAVEYMKANDVKGTLVLLGTPAEESEAGKVKMLQNNCLDGVDATMMVHPTWRTMKDMGSTACTRFQVEYFGKAAHAAGSPELGLNALDAILMLFNGINAYRQQMPEFTRIHGVILDAGKMPNIIPDHSSAKFYVRSTKEDWEEKLIARFKDIVKGAALMTGTEYKLTMYSLPYMSRKPNAPMNDMYFSLAEELGMAPEVVKEIGRGSSDFGNFSHACPGIHAYFAISDHKIPGHSIEMAEAAHTDFGFDMAMKAATAMAAIALRFLSDGEFRAAVRKDFEKAE
ncbi:MAG: M20 family metallopeptidase [Victivallales bacterium]|nr:M20 family metallopeptidase [Victivallales bacterium]